MRFRLAFSIIVCLGHGAFAPCAFAQPTGTVWGFVTDRQGHRLGGARVEISGEGAVGHYETTTDWTGRYRFPGLPVLEDLDIKAEFAGLTPVLYTGLRARDGTGTRRDFILRRPDQRDFLVIADARIPIHDVALDAAMEILGDAGSVDVLRLGEGDAVDKERIRQAAGGLPNGVLTIGDDAARLARRWILDIPVVAAMSLDPVGDDLEEQTNICGTWLNGGFDDALDLLETMKPGAARIATIYSPANLYRSVSELRDEVARRGMTLTAVAARQPGDVERATAELSAVPFDAFFLLMDPRIIDGEAFDLIRRFASSRRLVLVVPDRSLVVAGGTFSFGPGFSELGAHAARLLRTVVDDPVRPKDIGFGYPTTRYFALNPVESVRLELSVPADLESWLAETNKVEGLPGPGVETP